jgi:hypothetical protein
MIREHYPQLADHTNLASAPEAGFLSGVIAALKQLPQGTVPADIATRFAASIGSLEAAVQSCAPDPRRGHLTGRHVSELLTLALMNHSAPTILLSSSSTTSPGAAS